MSLFIDIISWVTILAGCFFCISGAVGLIRFPDFFTRMHGAVVLDSLGAMLILVGLAFQAAYYEGFLVTVKILLILGFMMITGPTAVHSLAKAALHGDEELGPEFKDRK